MVEFAYNNIKNANISHMRFELNCRCYPRIFFEKDIVPHLKLHSAKKLAKELRNLILICQ